MELSSERDPYSVVETQEFSERVVQILGSVENWDRIMIGLDLSLARRPRQGIRISGSARPEQVIWAFTIETNPSVAIYYRINDAARQILLIDLEVAE